MHRVTYTHLMERSFFPTLPNPTEKREGINIFVCSLLIHFTHMTVYMYILLILGVLELCYTRMTIFLIHDRPHMQLLNS
jgi:hypothetical protein